MIVDYGGGNGFHALWAIAPAHGDAPASAVVLLANLRNVDVVSRPLGDAVQCFLGDRWPGSAGRPCGAPMARP